MQSLVQLRTKADVEASATGFTMADSVEAYTHVVNLSDARSLVFNLLTGLSAVVDQGLVGAATRVVQGDALASPEELLVQIEQAFRARPKGDLSLVLIPTYGCNLSCSYCYEGKFTRDYLTWRMEDIPLVVSACQQLAERERAKMEDVSFTILGGEIIRRETIDVFVALASALRDAGARKFSAISNGFELPDHLEAIERVGITEVQITIDGVEAEHDKRRPSRYTKESTYRRALESVDVCLSRGIDVALRVNIDQRNVVGLGELAAVFEAAGYFDHPGFHGYLYPLSSDFNGKQKFVGEAELARLLSEVATEHPLVRRFRWDFHGLSYLYSLREGASARPKLRYCGATGRQYTIDVKQGVYSCWFGTGKDNFQLGEFATGKVTIDEALYQRWKQRGPLNMKPCRDCKWSLVCGGGCTFKAVERTGEIETPNCAPFAEIYEALGAMVYEPHAV